MYIRSMYLKKNLKPIKLQKAKLNFRGKSENYKNNSYTIIEL